MGVHVHVCEGVGDLDAPRRLAGLTRDDWLLAHCVHLPTDHELRGTILHNPMSNLNNAVGYAEPARFANPVALGTDGIGGNVLEAFRLAYVLQRSVDVTASPETAWSWLANGWQLVPEARDDEVTWSYDPMDPWHIAFTPGIRPLRVDGGRRGRPGGRPTDPRGRRRDPRQGPGAGRPTARPPLGQPTGARPPAPRRTMEHPMSDRFHPLSMEQLTDWAFSELERRGSVFGVPRASVFAPRPEHRFRRREYGVELETPWGVAAGPQTQMAQNIVTAWLAGARLIELKTIQTLDELEVNKPCIDVTDEGYNVEWSQELQDPPVVRRVPAGLGPGARPASGAGLPRASGPASSST